MIQVQSIKTSKTRYFARSNFSLLYSSLLLFIYLLIERLNKNVMVTNVNKISVNERNMIVEVIST